MFQAKALIHSKVFWIAVLQAVIGIVAVFQGAYPDVGWLLVAKSLLDVVMRTYTTTPIASVLPSES